MRNLEITNWSAQDLSAIKNNAYPFGILKKTAPELAKLLKQAAEAGC
jgi:hypothetical protein